MKDLGIIAVIGAGLIGALMYFNMDGKDKKTETVEKSEDGGQKSSAPIPGDTIKNSGTEREKTDIDISKESDLSPLGKEENKEIPEISAPPSEAISVKKKSKISY
jgi:hypothetical protein